MTLPTATIDSDDPELVEDEYYMPIIIVEPTVWKSMGDQSRHLRGWEARIAMSLAVPGIDAKGMHKDGRMVPLVMCNLGI